MNKKGFWKQLFVLLSVMLAGIVLTYTFMLIGVKVICGVSLMEATQYMTTSLAAVRWMQMLQNILVFILPACMVCVYSNCRVGDFLSLKRGRGNLGANLAVSFASMVAVIPLINLLAEWNEGIKLPSGLASLEAWMQKMEEAAKQTTELFLSGTSVMDLAINIVIIAFMAALSEEILFRGALLKMLGDAFKRRSSDATEISDGAIHLAIWVSAVLFSAFHMQFYGFFPRMLMGAWFGYMLWWTKSLWVPMMAHFINNAIAVSGTFAANRGWIGENFGEALGTGTQSWMSIVSVAVLVLCTLYFRKASKA